MRRRTHGSSPLARGLLPGHDPLRPGPRIIPARAGFTAVPRDHRRHRRDHPRSRGVYSQPASRDRAAGGSSPLARGLRETLTEALTRARIIPARAGFTAGRCGRRERHRDHPRSRGVYAAMRACIDGRRWIIPARAGFTLPRTPRGTRRTDHPRSRGVYSSTVSWTTARRGSSPLARGLLAVSLVFLLVIGIIPARAGFTRGLLQPRRRRRDHPRSRGVYVHGRQDHGLGQGSSPLARGLPLRILGIPTNPHSTRPLPPSLPT